MTPVASADTAGISVSKQPLSPEELRKMKDRKSTRLNSSHLVISYAVFCLKKKKKTEQVTTSSAAEVMILRLRAAQPIKPLQVQRIHLPFTTLRIDLHLSQRSTADFDR